MYLAHTFGPNVPLCDILNFGKDRPGWTCSKGVELVSLSGDHHTIEHLVESSSALSCDLTNATGTVEWFRNPYTVMCFSDECLGPGSRLFHSLVRRRGPLRSCSGPFPISVTPIQRWPR